MRILPVSYKQNTLKTSKNNSKLMNYTNSPLTLKNDTANFAFKGQNGSSLNLSMVLDLLTKPDESKRNALFYADFDEIEDYNKILGDGAPVIFQIAALAQDKNKQNVIHKLFIDTLKTYANNLGKDNYDENSFDFQAPLKMEKLSSVLKDKSPETIEKALLTCDKYGKTPLHFANIYNLATCKRLYGFTDIRDVSLNAILGNKNEGSSLNSACANLIYAIADSLGDKAPEVFAKAITIQDRKGNTPLHSISKEALEAIIDVLDDSAPEVLAQATLIPNKSGATPWFNTREGVLDLYIEALSDSAYDVLKEAVLNQSKYGINGFFNISSQKLDLLIDVFGDDAPEIIKEGLLARDKKGKSMLSYASDSEKVMYQELFGDEYTKIEKEAFKPLGLADRIFKIKLF